MPNREKTPEILIGKFARHTNTSKFFKYGYVLRSNTHFLSLIEGKVVNQRPPIITLTNCVFLFRKCFFLFLLLSSPDKVYSALTYSVLNPDKMTVNKKEIIFTHSLYFLGKSIQNILFHGKKYDTFASILIKGINLLKLLLLLFKIIIRSFL